MITLEESTFEERSPVGKAAEWLIRREVKFDDGTVEIYENTIPADTIEEAVREANDRNEMNMMLRHVERAQTIAAELISRKEA